MNHRVIQRTDRAIREIERLLSRGRHRQFSRKELKAIRGILLTLRAEITDKNSGSLSDRVVTLAMVVTRLAEILDKHFDVWA